MMDGSLLGSSLDGIDSAIDEHCPKYPDHYFCASYLLVLEDSITYDDVDYHLSGNSTLYHSAFGESAS